MLRKVSTLALTLALLPLLAMGQSSGKLSGRVVDRTTNEPLPGATIVIEGTQMGTATNASGDYFIIGVPVGAFDVRASFVGFESTLVRGVEINSGYTRELNFELSEDVAALDELVVEYERPMIQKDAIGVPKVVTGEEIQNLPVRGIQGVAALQGGVINNEGSNNLFVRGGREQEVVYFVDGVKVIGSASVPQQAIQEQEMLIGSLPAKFGDVTSGVISITTKTGGRNFFGSIEGITSEVLDPYGYNLGAISVGGPIAGNKLSFFLAGEYQSQDNRRATAIQVPTLAEDRTEFLRNNPQSLSFTDGSGNEQYLPLPGDLSSGSSLNAALAEMAARGLIPEGYSLGSPVPVFAAEVEPISNYEFNDNYPNYGQDVLTLSGNLTFAPSKDIRMRVTGRYRDLSQTARSLIRTTFASDRFRDDDQTTFGFGGSWTHHLSNSTFYQVQVDYSTFSRDIYDPAFSSDVRDVLFYGDIGHPGNAVGLRYKLWNGVDSTYDQRFEDGQLPGTANIYSILAAPGASDQAFQRNRDNQFRISANATTQVGLHQIEFGGEFEQRTERFYNAFGGRGGNAGAARFYNDDNIEGGGAGADSWDDLTFGQVRNWVRYWGYDYLGVTDTDTQDVDAFVTGSDESHATEPYQPIYYAGYIQDKIEYRDLVVNLGLRVDVFDDNGVFIFDKWALVPIERANVVAGRPSNIDGDYAVYFDPSGEVIGYRDLEANFFNADGQEADGKDITNAGQVRIPDGKEARLSSEVFKDYDPEVTWMPRIGVSFPVTDQALFFAHYDKTSQRPYEFEHEGLAQLLLAQETGQTRPYAVGLRPTTTTEYELGFRQRLGARSAFTVSGFYKNINDLIQIEQTFFAFPSAYGYYGNNDFGTVKGVELEFDLRRTGGVAINANYTLSFAEGTGSDGQTAQQIQWRGTSPDDFPNFISPLDFDRRHSINLNMDYRLGQGEGPMIGGAALLENFGFNVVANLRAGQPYTPLVGPNPIYNSFITAPAGGINSETLPWSTLVNLRVDRRFDLTDKVSLTAYLWVQNLLNQDNVLTVYRATGVPSDDGFLSSGEGQDYLSNQIEPEIARSLYGFRANDPLNYGLPRQTRLGLRLNF